MEYRGGRSGNRKAFVGLVGCTNVYARMEVFDAGISSCIVYGIRPCILWQIDTNSIIVLCAIWSIVVLIVVITNHLCRALTIEVILSIHSLCDDVVRKILWHGEGFQLLVSIEIFVHMRIVK